MKTISPCLWFDHQAEEAANFYVSIFKHSKITHVARYGDEGAKASGRPKGTVMTVTFELNGQEFMALNGGPIFQFSQAISFMVPCNTQKDVDALWDTLSQGGERQPCGWLKDRYGVAWQIVPTVLDKMMRDKDAAKSERVMKALLTMDKPDINALKAAYAQR